MKKIAGGLLIAFSLIGCGEEVKSVEWYKMHKKERRETLKGCHIMPGEKEKSQNCINARKAETTYFDFDVKVE